jgi:hypothetical protein
MNLFGKNNLNDDSLSDEKKKEIYEERLKSNNTNFKKSDYSVRKVIKYESGGPPEAVYHLNFKIGSDKVFKLVEGYEVNIDLVDNFKSKIEKDSRTKDLIKVNDRVSWKTKNPPRTKAMIELWLKDGIQLNYPEEGNYYANVKTFDKSTEVTQQIAQTPAEVTQQITQESGKDDEYKRSVPLTLKEPGAQVEKDEEDEEVTQQIVQESEKDEEVTQEIVQESEKDEEVTQEIVQESEKDEEVSKEKSFFKKYMIVIIIVVLLLLGVVGYFMFGGKSSGDDSGMEF